MPAKKYHTDEERRAADAERKRLQRANETDDAKRARLDRRGAAQRAKLANETSEQRQIRIDGVIASHRKRCESETDEQRQLRLANHAQHRRQSIQNQANRQNKVTIFKQMLIDSLDNEDLIVEHDCGNMSFQCSFCNSKNFQDEKVGNNFTRCCREGRVKLPDLTQPKLLEDLFMNRHSESKSFKEHIRGINCSLAFASMGANLQLPKNGSGPYCFRVQGSIYHRTGALHPDEGNSPAFSQIYILDESEAALERLRQPGTVGVSEDLMKHLTIFFNENNPLAQAYKMLHQVENEMLEIHGPENMPEILMAIKQDRNCDPRRYNQPRVSEVAIVFENADGEPPMNRDLIVHLKSGENSLKRISILDPNLDAMIYPLFYPYGNQSWHTDLYQTTGSNKKVRISQKQYYCYILSVRDGFNPLLHGGKLTQQYFVDGYCRMEANRTNYIIQNQKRLRVENYNSLREYLAKTNMNAEQIGKMVILPSSFEGSPRNQKQRYNDAMAIVTKFGKPDLFVTMTCNPKWKDIQVNLDNEEASNRPDIVARVFKLKLKAVIKDIEENQIFGKVKAMIYVIEFQKRGLPHAHILITLDGDDKIKTEEDVDKIVSAEIPDPVKDKRLYEIVTKQMIHGPCGKQNPKCVCMDGDTCTKKFPKMFNETTLINVNGYPQYKRRENPAISLNNKSIDNSWVVPYNRYLLLAYNCHINVEICSSIQSVKYLYKYVYKGHDCANIEIGSSDYNEVRNFLNTRYVSPPEAAWRIFGFEMHKQSHAVIRLDLHLPDQQPVYFDPSEAQEAAQKATERETMLTDYFRLNSEDDFAKTLYYREIPEHYTWVRSLVDMPDGSKKHVKRWERRKGHIGKIIGRIAQCGLNDQERYFLRLLFLHIKAATSFEFLRTVDGIIYPTFMEACRAKGLLLDDELWRSTIEDAIVFSMPSQIRNLFAYVCVYSEICHLIKDLWQEFKKHMFEDYCHKLHKGLCHDDTYKCESYALRELEELLSEHRRTLAGFNLPEPPSDLGPIEMIRDYDFETASASQMIETLNEKQKEAFDNIADALYNRRNKTCFFIDGPGGSGKTYLYRLLLHFVRGKKDIALPSASTGIAAILLDGGRTFHKLFGLIVPITENSGSRIIFQSKEADELREAKLIIIDECTMASNHALTAIDNLLQEIMKNTRPFGGKVIVLGGDFRQCLAVIPHAKEAAIVQGSLTYSPSWRNFKRLPLDINVRSVDNEYSHWLMELGNGVLTNSDELDSDLIEIPNQMICNGDLITEIFGDCLSIANIKQMSRRAILCPKNTDVDKMNEEVLNLLPGDVHSYLSEDSIVTDDEDVRELYPIEFLHSVTPSGMPPHELNLKVGTVVMLLRNLNLKRGLCNGTRLVIKSMRTHVIEAEILAGSSEGEICLIPRIDLCPSETSLPFQLKRRQFPVKPAFVMTINKSQGQTLDRVGLYLPEPVFGHGQLYVAFSRVRRQNDVKVKVLDGPSQGHLIEGSDKVFTRNVVYRDVLKRY